MLLKSVGKYLGELLIVVIGITIAFQLNVWNDNSKSRQLKEDLLHSFKTENHLNNEEVIESLLKVHETIDVDLKLIEMLKNSDTEMDSIRYQIAVLYNISWPEFTTTHLENFLNFNEVNSPLREEMLVLKTHYDAHALLINTYKDQKQLKYFDYLSDALDMTANLKVVKPEKVLSVQFRNNIMIISAYEQSLEQVYNQISQKQIRIDSLMAVELRIPFSPDRDKSLLNDSIRAD